ncbi:hypothetical protein [Streptomyces goshikiensis]|uniref:hypothetical protein n=1 Tax=Streptomyces goshikiensis TaxID=1942 RepID=UPI0022F3FAFC|nr:hypothetical protein [Streptomyces goshikiensis]WBY25014.1 hypothetical protein PET44_35910 [Streptomyces goshikiensis]
METNTNQHPATSQPEALPQRWAIILIGGFVAGAAVFALGGLLPALGAAGLTVMGLHKLIA